MSIGDEWSEDGEVLAEAKYFRQAKAIGLKRMLGDRVDKKELQQSIRRYYHQTRPQRLVTHQAPEFANYSESVKLN